MQAVKRGPVAYLRRSNGASTVAPTDDKSQSKGHLSFKSQSDAVRSLAASRGDADRLEVITEWGVSGADRAGAFGGTRRGGKRRAYYELRTRIDAGEVSALYAYSLSRLARSTRELLDLAEACVAQGVPIRLAKEGDIDGTTPSGRLYLTVLAAVSTFEAEVSAERGKDRNDAMRERGDYVGRNPYGTLIDPATHKLVPDPATAPIVQRVIDLYTELKSPQKVARQLNAEGIPAPEGGTIGWRDGTVRRILARQPGAKPPATVRGSRAVPSAMFARLLTCHCGGRMTPKRKHYTTARGEPRMWMGYTCQTARVDGHHDGPQAVAESVVIASAKAEAARLRLPDAVEMTAKADAEREDIAARRGRIVDALEAGTITRPEADERLARLAAKLAALEAGTDVVEVPALDWSWPPETVNGVLRALWSEVRMDTTMTPVEFVWRLPAEYVA